MTLRFAIAALLTAVLGQTSNIVFAAQDEARLTAVYDYYWAGFPIARSETDIRLNETDYHVTSSARTRGMIDMLYAVTVESRAGGLLNGTGAEPALYASKSTFNEKSRTVELVYGADGSVLVSRSPADDEAREKVPEDLRPGTMDPLSAIMTMGVQREGERACDGKVRVFDGVRRYDLTFEAVAEVELDADGFSAYQGPALKCLIHFHRIAGFRRDYLEENPEAPPPVTLWVARLDNGRLLVPVKVEAEAFFGSVLGGALHIDYSDGNGFRLTIGTKAK